MAIGTTPPPAAKPPDARLIAYERFIEKELRKTGSSVKAIDIASGLMVLATVGLAFLLLVAVVDHWLVPGGLGSVGRSLFFVTLISAAGYYFVRQVLPVVVRRINPAYSALTIERSAPSLKNSLLNFLMFRGDRQAVSEEIYEAIETQAAQRLSRAHVDVAVDRTRLIQIGYVLIGVVVLYSLYLVLSPKNPLITAGRVIMPWADIAPPTRVSIQEVEPGSATVVRGERLTVSAVVAGVDDDEPVTLFYTTDDGQTVDQPVAMYVPNQGYRHQCELPIGEAGIFEPLRYRIEAGDAVTRGYPVKVVAAPSIVVSSIDYDYPRYTGLSRRTIVGEGDIKAIEGTQVTIHGEANYPIKAASLDFDCDGRSELRMKAENDKAAVSFTLSLTGDRRAPKHSSYQLRFTNEENRRNNDPVEHKIEVIRDLSPEVVILSPEEDLVDVPLDGSQAIEVQAIDPDFSLRRVEIRGEVEGKDPLVLPLLKEDRSGQFLEKLHFRPAEHSLEPGDVVEVWAVARDNKTPEPNTAESGRKRLRIVAPENRGREEEGEKGREGERGKDADAEQKDKGEGQQGEGREGEGQEGKGQEGEGQQGQKGEGQEGEKGEGQQGEGQEGAEGKQSGQGEKDGQNQEGGSEGQGEGEQQQGEGGQQDAPAANDGSDDGTLFDKIKDYFDKEQAKKKQEQGGKQPQGDQGSDRPQDGQQGQPGSQDGESSEKGQPEAGKQPSAGQPSGKQPQQGDRPAGEEKQPGDQSPNGDSNQDGDTKPQADRPEGGQPKGGQPRGEKSAERPAGQPEGAGSEKQPGTESKGGESQPGEKPDQPAGRRPDARGGDGNENQGKPGADQRGKDDTGTPDSQEGIQPKREQSEKPDGSSQSQDKPKSPAHGKKESDSDGSQGGDKSGGGEEGGGQKSPRQGTGSDGQNTAADEGGGEAEDSGQGNTSQRGGDDVEAQRPTGDQGKRPGEGSQSQPKTGEQEGGKPSPGQQGKSPNSGQPTEQESQPDPSKPGQPSGGQPGPGGQAGNGPPKFPEGQLPEPGGDDPNLEYARKSTDLVLDELDQQLKQDEVDQQLLDKLGWTKDDARQFVNRWRKMQDAAGKPGEQGEEASQELDEALRSLGLRETRVRRGSDSNSDDLRNLREAHRSTPPPEYADQVKAYRKGLSKRSGAR